MIKAVIFDCFGVLYPNASRQFFKRHRNLFRDNSALLDKLNLQIDLGQITRAEFFAELEKEIGIPAFKIKAEIDNDLVLDQKLARFIKELKTKYKTAILSNAGQEEITIIYRDKIDTLFDAITVSYETGIVKPSKEIYFICARRLGVKPIECLLIDDNLANINTAQEIGMKTMYYSNFDTFSHEFNAKK
ncbi:HAD-IA family hydrolase [Patescibacteria group bacterium]|nr:HAD-IA family hydrolase [Patescibacteria group bacterium]